MYWGYEGIVGVLVQDVALTLRNSPILVVASGLRIGLWVMLTPDRALNP